MRREKFKIRNWLKLRPNQIGIAFAFVHWILLGISIWDSSFRFERIGAITGILILICDLPAIIPTVIFWSPLCLWADFRGFSYGAVFTGFFAISWEWILISRAVLRMFTPLDRKTSVLMLSDD